MDQSIFRDQVKHIYIMSRGKILNVQLISLVQTYPVLYDGLAAATKQQKTLAWEEIAYLLKADVGFLRKRWQSLCITFKKVVEMNRTNWIYYKYMSWFLPSSHVTQTANNTVDELEQFLDTLKPVNSVPVENEVYQTPFNIFNVHIKSEPAIDLLPDYEGELGRESEDYLQSLPDIDVSFDGTKTDYEISIDDSQDSIGESTADIPIGKRKHTQEPYLNLDKKSKSADEPESTDSAEKDNYATVETMDAFFASMAKQAKRLSHEQQLQLQIRCREVFSQCLEMESV